MQKAYISGGSNVGDRKKNLEFALSSLAAAGSVAKISSCFETEPVGYLNQPWFLNVAIEIDTPLTPLELLFFCQDIERSCGRTRTFPNAPRTLDLDILLFGDFVICEERLIVPHPRMQDRKFVLAPLAQIAPEFIHPVLKQSIRSLLDNCPDTSEIRQI